MLRKICLLLVLGLIAHRSAAATALEFSYKDPVFIDVAHTAKAEFGSAGQNFKIEMKVQMLFKIDTGEESKKSTVCDVTIVECDASMSMNGKPVGENPLKGLKNQKFEVVIAEDNQKIELRKLDAMIKSMMGAEAAGATAEQKADVEDSLKTSLQKYLSDALAPLPAEPVEKGDKWKHKQTTDIQGLADVTVDREFVFQGEKAEGEKQLANIEWSGNVDVKGKKPEPGEDPVTISEKAGTKQKNEGSIKWDIAAERPASIESSQSYSLEIKGEENGKKVTASLKTDETYLYTYFDKNPSK